ncbi:MAG: hypothetical protein IPF44_06905 [Betaproteobacteria bacterium]|nr:hypothetical protein [Betaproteobacteria bacterium]MBP6189610.1 hypothetical protein [Azonexus sp.]
MSHENSTQHPGRIGLDAPAVMADDGKFFVTLTEEVHTVRAGPLPRGVHLLIDPAADPKDMDTVLVGNRLEPWAMQPGIRGVAIQYHEHFR